MLAALGRVEERQAKTDSQLVAIVSRLDDQEDALARLTGKVDRLAIQLNLSAQASEQALTEITSPSRRVTRLEREKG